MFQQQLQFEQQQAALQQSGNVATQYGYAPGGNWMTWGQGGPTQPTPGTPTLADLASQMGITQGTLQNALASSGVTGQYRQPLPSQYAPGTVLRANDAPNNGAGTSAAGIVNADGSVTMLAGPALDQLAQQRGTNSQALLSNAAPIGWQQLQTLTQGPAQGAPQQTLAAQQQQYTQALGTAGLTGQFIDPTMQSSYLLSQGKAMNGSSFADLPPDQQQYWLSYNNNDFTQASQQWARAINGALQNSGYTNAQAGPQQTLAAINQAAQLSGMYNGAPTEAAYQFNQSQAQQMAEFQQQLQQSQAQLGQQYLSTASQLQGPQNTFQLSNYLRGAQGNPNVPTYLNALANGTNMAAFTGTGNTAPQQNTMGGLQQAMGGSGNNYYNQAAGSFANGGTGTSGGTATTGGTGGQGTLSGWNYGDTLNAINSIASKGAQALSPGSLEKLSPDEMQAFGSGLGAAGYDLSSFMNQYNSSRVGQNAPIGAMGMSNG